MAARQLPSGHVGDPRHPPQSAPRLLPRSCRRWPRVSTPGHARIYAMAVELIRHSDSRLDRQQLVQFLNSYQRVAPLTIGELWAWPSMLKLALIENLRRLADEMLAARAARRAADAYVSRADDGRDARARCRRRSTPRSSCSSCTASASTACACRRSASRSTKHLALAADDSRRGDSRRAPAAGRRRRSRSPTPSPACGCARRSTGASTSSRSAWSSRCCSAIPAGAYARMDFLSRDRQRQAVEELAEPSGEAQVRVALQGDRERAPGGRQRLTGRSRGPRRLPPDRSRRRDLEADARATAPRLADAGPAPAVCATRPLLYLGADRGR